jgi:hypothetical protein
MEKKGPMDMFIKRRNMNAEHQTNSDSSSQSVDGDINETETSSAKRIRTSFTRKYDSSYIRFGFVSADDASIPKPQCVICGDVLSNDAMKPSKLQRHLTTRHKDISSKPKEFFDRKRADLKSCQKLIFDSSHINTCALRASYKVALRIAKAKKPYTIGEALVVGCIKDVCLEMLGETAAKKVTQVPLSNDTIARRIDDMACDIEAQLIEHLKLAKYFSLQLDESTDIANLAILMVYVRYQYKDDLKEEYFFSTSLPTNTTSSEIFKAVHDYIVGKCQIEFKYCVGVCTDGAAAMTGRRSGVVTKIKELAPECKLTHCVIHRESLATKQMSTELNNVLSEVVKIVNHVKANALNSRLFAALCDGMGAEHKQLLLHADVRWLSRGKVLSRVFELRRELDQFLLEEKPDWSQLFRNVNWTAKLAYLADIFAIFNELNISMQGRMASCFTMADKIDGQKRKLEAWKSRVSADCFDMFHNLATTIDGADEELDVPSLQKVIIEHLTKLIDRFELYFPTEDDPRKGTGWIRNPFIASKVDLSVTLEDKLLELAADEGLKMNFGTMTSLASFWIHVSAEYPELAEIALKALLPFPSSYLCETGFSTMSIIKTKYRNSMDVRSPLRVALSSIEPRLDKLAKNKQAHMTH